MDQPNRVQGEKQLVILARQSIIENIECRWKINHQTFEIDTENFKQETTTRKQKNRIKKDKKIFKGPKVNN